MSQVLVKERTADRVPVRRRSPVIDATLIIAGGLVALVGVYFQFGPSGWWLGHVSEVYYLGSYILSGLLLMAGFTAFADRAWEEDGRWSTRCTVGITLATVAFVAAVVVSFLLV